MPGLAAAAALAALAWVYLVAGHGGYWRTDQRLPRGDGPRGDGPRGDGPRGDGPRGDGPRGDGPRGDGPRGDGPRPDGPRRGHPQRWPAVVAVVPARDEAAILPLTLPTLLTQDYPGRFEVVLVDDRSSDGTAAVAATLAGGARTGALAGGARTGALAGGAWTGALAGGARTGALAGGARTGAMAGGTRTGAMAGRSRAAAALLVVRGQPGPDGWVGKVWAMEQGIRAAGESEYVLFTDADIAYEQGMLTALVDAAVADRLDLVSQMALLRAQTAWERILVPAFVYFFAKLYPFRRVNRPGARTAAAAGGCMLVHRQALADAGGMRQIRGALIDDVALGRLLKRSPVRGRCWLGFGTGVISRRPYPRLAELWQMVARSAYCQLRYSRILLACTIAGLLWLYLIPPVAALAGPIGVATGGGAAAWWCAAAGLAGWLIMAATYLPVLRLYRLSPLRALGLPLIALMYAAMTLDSARQYRAGRGAAWKGRIAGQSVQAHRCPQHPGAVHDDR